MNTRKNIILLLITVVLFLSVFLLSNSLFETKNNSDWYGVKLADGTVYYGHILQVTSGEIVLEDVYSIEAVEQSAGIATSQNFQLQSAPQKVYNLVHRATNAANKTDNRMIVNRASVMFWEKMAPDAEIIKLIKKAKQQKE